MTLPKRSITKFRKVNHKMVIKKVNEEKFPGKFDKINIFCENKKPFLL